MPPDCSSFHGFTAPSVDELTPLFPAYEIIDFIAQGGMGAVYRARQKSLDRLVAIKILPREFGADEQFREAFEAEAKAMARLNHPNLIAVYDFGDVDGMLFIIMEFVEGKALYYSSHGKQIDPAAAIGIVSAIAQGLEHAHREGIIHRDIKPANILLGPDAQPKIGDFGLARPLDRERADGVTLGTPGYTAPEVYHREQPIDQRSDIFSLGALLYELLCGSSPEPNSTSMRSGVDARIDVFLAKATHPDPHHRYLRVEDFANDLNGVVAKLSGPRFATPPLTTGAPKPAAPIKALASSKKQSLTPVLLSFLLLAGVVGLTYTLLIEKDDQAPKVSQDTSGTETPSSQDLKTLPKETITPEPVVKTQEPKPPLETTPPPQEKKIETPLQALARLKKDLLEGKRSEFPPSSVTQGDSTYFLVSTKLTWREARDFAEDHGAQLALFPTTEKIHWAAKTFSKNLPAWVGASDSGTEKRWVWEDGTAVEATLWAKGEPNNLTTQELDGEDFAALSQDEASLVDLADMTKSPFILEWKSDAQRPGSLANQLKRTGDALQAKKPPVFPNGSFNVGGARFLLVQKALNWESASKLCQSAGGHLAVLSNPKEAAFVYKYLKERLPENSSCWLGARRNPVAPEIWNNITGELFDYHQWSAEQPDNRGNEENYLVLLKKGGSLGANDERLEGHLTQFFLLEWSLPSLQNLPKSPFATHDLANAEQVLEMIRDQLRSSHEKNYRKYRRKYDAAVEGFLKDTIDDAQRLPGPLRNGFVDYLNGYVERNELPANLPPRTPERLQNKLKEAQEDAKAANEEGKETFEKIKSQYLTTLKNTAAAAFSQTHHETGKALTVEQKLIVAEENRFHAIMGNREVAFPAFAPQDN